ncbi:Thiol-disulfide isomerase or thioredoxin [Ruminococcaceae bacterium YRB3002]|nr:Thiol-disulfide isomerase or thioredoxin [Ruminococcaceae bacterium YRB3002]
MTFGLTSCSISGDVPRDDDEETTEEETEDETEESEAETEEETYPTEEYNGRGLRFHTTDREGKRYDESIFAKAKVTMINFWEPWCGYCVEEMPALQQLADKYKDKGFQVIGIYSDMTMEDDVDDILGDGNISYQILQYSTDFDAYNTGYMPTTIFVDSSGNLITPPGRDSIMIGPDTYEGWESVITSILK